MEFGGSKLRLEEVTCLTCGDPLCTRQECQNACTLRYFGTESSPTYAEIVKNPSNIKRGGMNIPSLKGLKMFGQDVNYKPVSIVGGFNNREFQNVLSILSDKYLQDYNPNNNDDMVMKLKDFVSGRNRTSVIGSLNSSVQSVNTDIRNSLSVDFNGEVVEKLSGILEDKIMKAFESTTVNPRMVKLHPDHGSLILYDKKGSKFKIHRDKVLKCPFKGLLRNTKKQMFSFILCLGSKMKDRIRSNSGNTVVYFPPVNNENGHNFFEYYGNLAEYKLVPHIFNETVIPGEFVGFPSEAKHQSLPLEEDGEYKFILKLDFWIKDFDNYDYIYFNTQISNRVNNLTMSSQYCNCKVCDPFRQRLAVFKYNTLLRNTTLSEDLIRLILSYAIDNRRMCNHIDITKYMPDNHYFLKQKDEEWQEYNDHMDDMDDRYCNGWEDEW
jgi:hypothetical protein